MTIPTSGASRPRGGFDQSSIPWGPSWGPAFVAT